MGNIRYFETGDGAFPDLFKRKLRLLLTWGVTSECGGHKYFAVASILYHWRERAKHRKIVPHPKEFLHNELFEWLDTSDIARDRAHHLDSTALLYEELVRRGLFSYTKFIQKLIARGEIRSGGGVEVSCQGW
jgi:mediator of RNA polymerase II transcription subunit 12, fungi type